MNIFNHLNKKEKGLKGVIREQLHDIRDALTSGFSKKDIHEAMYKEGFIKKSCSYPYFLKVLNEVLNSQEKDSPGQKQGESRQQGLDQGSFKLKDLEDDDFK